MDYKFLVTINIFEVHKIQSTLDKFNIESIIEDNYHLNLTAGWVDPFCNYNERRILVKNEDIELIIDPPSELLLLGTTIDYVKEDYSKKIYESKFLFKPKKDYATTCGCGTSFSPK